MPFSQIRRILIIDDDQSICESLERLLKRHGYQIQIANTGDDGIHLFETHSFHAVLLDYSLRLTDGIQVSKKLIKKNQAVPIIMISAYGTIPTAVEAMKIGVYDFIEKPLDRNRLLLTLRNAMAQFELKKEIEQLQHDHMEQFQMIAQSAVMNRVFDLIERVAPLDIPVLIAGPNGSGKELVAQAIHQQSRQKKEKLVKVNCAAIPENLFESELFGHVKGAFTGAFQSKRGRCQLADNGTLFLDEVGLLSLTSQAKLLRFLENGEIQPVGSEVVSHVSVRIISASNDNLPERVENKTFREDLYFRLNGITIEVPPLKERREDVPLLIEHFLTCYAERNGISKPVVTVPAMNALKAYHWPGNVRQLQQVTKQMLVLRDRDLIDAPLIQRILNSNTGDTSAQEMPQNLHAARDQFEKKFIEEALAHSHFQVTDTAKLLGIDRAYLYRKMRNLGIDVTRK